MGLRHRSIRLRVFLLVIIPILSLIGLYAFAASVTVGDALNLARAKTVKNVIATPTTVVQNQLNAERGLAMLYLARPTSRMQAALGIQEAKTDKAVKAFEATVGSRAITSNASAQENVAIRSLVNGTAGLPALRAAIAQHAISRPAALNAYSDMSEAGFQVLDQAVEAQTNVPLVVQANAVIKLDQADQAVVEESNLLVSDLTAGSFPTADRREFTELAATRRFLIADNVPQLNPVLLGYYHADLSPTAASTLTALEDKVISAKAGTTVMPPIEPLAWSSTAAAYASGLGKALLRATNDLTGGAEAQANHTYLQLILAGGLGLLAIVASILFSVVIGRGLIRPLAALRQAALDLANDRLPGVMERLRAGRA